MSHAVAEKIIDFIFTMTPAHEIANIGFFGGEPLLEFDLIRDITNMIKSYPQYEEGRVGLSIVTNGTIFSNEMATFIEGQSMDFCISCDGPPFVHDKFRRFRNGRKTSAVVENTIRKAVEVSTSVAVNSVYTPDTLSAMSDTVDYFISLGLNRIFLSADLSANWTNADVSILEREYHRIAEKYISSHLKENPYFINIIDNKITAFLRGGYQPSERCRLGAGEFAFTPAGNIYGCERLIGSDDDPTHRLGDIFSGLNLERLKCNSLPDAPINAECIECGIKDYCMNWCSCSNYFSSGYYNRVSAFLCASERTAVKNAFYVFQRLERDGNNHFLEHLAGRPYAKTLTDKSGRG